MAGEAGYDYLALSIAKCLVKCRADRRFRFNEPGHFSIRGIRHKKVHTLLAQPRELTQISDLMVQRQLVKLHVPCVDNMPCRCPDRYRKRIRDRMRHRNKFKVERPRLHLVPALNRLHNRFNMMFLAFRLHECQGEL